MKIKRFLALILALMLCLSFSACDDQPAGNGTTSVHEPDVTQEHVDAGELVILFTNDVHNAYLPDDALGQMGYAALAAYRDQLEEDGKTVVLIDGGDSLQGDAVGTLSHGAYPVDIMNAAGYELSVPGNHEFDYGMETFLDLAENHAEFDYISCNFVDLTTGQTVFDPYRILEYNGKKVAFLGISTPETLSKSRPTNFQNDAGEFIYGFCQGNDGQDLYDAVQKAIDDARAEGADYVIAVGHTGTAPESSPWTSYEIISNTTGLSAYLDGHSHSIVEGEIILDKDDNEVPLCSAGSKMTYVGEIRLDLNSGAVTVSLVDDLTEEAYDVRSVCDDIYSQLEDLLNEVVARSEVDLVTQNPDDPDDRIVREMETNLGDFCADAYRAVLDADVAFINGGGIRAEVKSGPVTYGDIISVHPYNNLMCVANVSGQTILDALELAYSQVGSGELGAFLHVSGLSCQVDPSIPSNVVVNDEGEFQEITGQRRVQNVMIGGEPIAPEKMYTVASHNYMLKSAGGGYTMFKDSEMVADEVCLDHEVLIRYIEDHLGGVIPAELYGDPYGDGRIRILETSDAE